MALEDERQGNAARIRREVLDEELEGEREGNSNVRKRKEEEEVLDEDRRVDGSE